MLVEAPSSGSTKITGGDFGAQAPQGSRTGVRDNPPVTSKFPPVFPLNLRYPPSPLDSPAAEAPVFRDLERELALTPENIRSKHLYKILCRVIRNPLKFGRVSMRFGHQIRFFAVLCLVLFTAASTGDFAHAQSIIPVPRTINFSYEKGQVAIPAYKHCVDEQYIRPAAGKVSVCTRADGTKRPFNADLDSGECDGGEINETLLVQRTVTVTRIILNSVPGAEFVHIHVIPTDNLPLRGVDPKDVALNYPDLEINPGSSYNLPNCSEELSPQQDRAQLARSATPEEEFILGRLYERGIKTALTIGFGSPTPLIFDQVVSSGPQPVFEGFTPKCGENKQSRDFNVNQFLETWERNGFRFTFDLFRASAHSEKGGGEASGAGALRAFPGINAEEMKRLGEQLQQSPPSPSALDEARRAMDEGLRCGNGGDL